mgnify:CR=1 FL=1
MKKEDFDYEIRIYRLRQYGICIIGGILNKGLAQPEDICASVKTQSSAQKIQNTLGISCTTDNLEVAKTTDYLFLAVKPQFCTDVALQIKDVLTDKQVIISVIAGKIWNG